MIISYKEAKDTIKTILQYIFVIEVKIFEKEL